MGRRLIRWCRRHIIRTNLIILGVEVIAACLIWFIWSGTQDFPTLTSYVIICFSVVIASIAALNSMFASVAAHDSFITTSESLELTRKMIRPFLYTAGSIDVKRVGNHITLVFAIQNSGSLPANDVKTDIQFFDKDEEITEENLSSKYAPLPEESISPILFPNSTIYRNYVLNLKEANDLELFTALKEGKTECRVQTKYASLGIRYLTIQTIKLAKLDWAKGIFVTPILPQKWQ